MKILVQKFGGTSVATSEKRAMVAQKIIRAKKSGSCIVVVVSAMGRKGDPYATDTFIDMVKELSPEVDLRELDMLMSCGEIISGILLSSSLKNMGYPSCFLTGLQAGIITDTEHGNASILRIDPQRVIGELQEDKIVVVAGFQGVSETGEVTTLGRGGSDTTAAALGVALNAEAVEIYTDVDGVKTADPRLVNNTKTLEQVTYSEVCQLAYEGAKVVHPRAVEIAMQRNIPLKIKCTFNDNPGTLISSNGGTIERGAIRVSDRLITGITHSTSITQIKIPVSEEFLARRVFNSLALAGISVDFINILPELLLFTVKTEVAKKAVKILENLNIQVEVKDGCAKVATVGAGMTGIPGVVAKIVEALTEENIEILQSADSYTSIWCLIAEDDLEKAVNALHKKFIMTD
ncbi:aspartate kinase [Desulfitibacter alkalitolerans]|uniref:aspartate kinase n=1 Tax=Desulfitibacter alkalitolerans TaxID=264641 RepID=UPI000480ACD5